MGGSDPVRAATSAVSNATGGLFDGAAKDVTNVVSLGFGKKQIYGSKQYEKLGYTSDQITAIQTAMDDPTIDSQTKLDLQKQLTLSNDSVNPNSTLEQIRMAKAGEGMYGIRRKNTELVKMLLDQPGRRQTLLTDQGNSQRQTVQETILPGGGKK